MFGVDVVNDPQILLASELHAELTELAATHEYAYGVLYLSRSTFHFAKLIYLRDHANLLTFLEQFARGIAEAGDDYLVVDYLLVESAQLSSEGLRQFRGVFEYTMGFHQLGFENLVPLEEILQAAEEFWASDDPTTYFQTLAPRQSDADVIEDLLRSLDGKTPGDFGPGIH